MSSKFDIKVLHVNVGIGKWEQVEKKNQVSVLRTKVKDAKDITEEQFGELWKMVLAGKDEPEFSEDTPAKDQKKIKDIFKRLLTVLKNHQEEAKKVAELQAEEDKKKAEEGVKLTLAKIKGEAIAVEYSKQNVAGIQSLLGDDFVSSSTGLVPADGITVTAKMLVEALSKLGTADEKMADLKNAIGWNMADLCRLAFSMGETEGDEIIGHAMAVTGRSKQTCNEAIRLGGFFEPEEREEGLSWTHHQTIMNHRGVIEKHMKAKGKTLAEVKAEAIAYALDGEVQPGIDANGKKYELKKPKSVKLLREYMVKLDPDYKEPVPKAPVVQSTEGETGGAQVSTTQAPKEEYLYIQFSTGIVSVDSKLHLTACADEDYGVYDLISRQMLDSEGKEAQAMPPLADEVRDPEPVVEESAPEPTSEPTKSKVVKPAAKAAVAATVPD